MNISDLNYLEQMNQSNDLVGGYYYSGDDFDVTTIQKQLSNISQDATSTANATTQFDGAFAGSDAANIAALIQGIG
jgi:hypothetical protein